MLVMQPVSLPCMWGTTDPLVCWCLEQLMNMWIVQPCVSFWHTCVLCASQPSQCSAYCIDVHCPIGTLLLLVSPAPMKQWSWRGSCMGCFVMQPGHNLWWCVWHTSDTLKWHLGMSCHSQSGSVSWTVTSWLPSCCPVWLVAALMSCVRGGCVQGHSTLACKVFQTNAKVYTAQSLTCGTVCQTASAACDPSVLYMISNCSAHSVGVGGWVSVPITILSKSKLECVGSLLDYTERNVCGG